MTRDIGGRNRGPGAGGSTTSRYRKVPRLMGFDDRPLKSLLVCLCLGLPRVRQPRREEEKEDGEKQKDRMQHMNAAKEEQPS
jgi:hypothetical protein